MNPNKSAVWDDDTVGQQIGPPQLGLMTAPLNSSYKYLGIIIQRDGGWKKQIDSMDIRLKAACKWLSKTPYKIQDRVWIAESYILPSIGYGCNAIWPGEKYLCKWQKCLSKAIAHEVCHSHLMKEELLCSPIES